MLIIDRFEGNYAVIETSDGTVNIPRSDIPSGAKESDVLLLVADSGATEERKKRIDEKMNRLFKG